MRIVKKLMMVIGLVLTVSCATPTTPSFPAIDCKQVVITKEEVKVLSTCKLGMVCTVPHYIVKKMHDIIQSKASCVEQYKAGASKFK